MTEDDPYIIKQDRNNVEYEKAWEDAPEIFKTKAALLGMECDPGHSESLDVEEFNDNLLSTAVRPDMAAALDLHVDFVVEKYADRVPAVLIRNIAEDLSAPMYREQERNKADLLGKIAGNLIYIPREKGNILARIHALIHSIPRYAKEAGFTSMRASAKACRVSPEWLRRNRDQWCVLLDIEPPVVGTKTDTAKKKYTDNAKSNHWRYQKYKHTSNE